MSKANEDVKYYRCGYCGRPTDENGTVLSGLPYELSLFLLKCDAELTHCECCPADGLYTETR